MLRTVLKWAIPLLLLIAAAWFLIQAAGNWWAASFSTPHAAEYAFRGNLSLIIGIGLTIVSVAVFFLMRKKSKRTDKRLKR